MHKGRPQADPLTRAIMAFVNYKDLERAAAYNNRGQTFAALDARELASRWRAAFTAWAADPTD